jgi:hypothetical protein
VVRRIVARGPRDAEIAKMRGQKITGLRYFPAVVDFLDIRKASGLPPKVRIMSRTARPLRNLPNGLSRLIKRKDLRHRPRDLPFFVHFNDVAVHWCLRNPGGKSDDQKPAIAPHRSKRGPGAGTTHWIDHNVDTFGTSNRLDRRRKSR